MILAVFGNWLHRRRIIGTLSKRHKIKRSLDKAFWKSWGNPSFVKNVWMYLYPYHPLRCTILTSFTPSFTSSYVHSALVLLSSSQSSSQYVLLLPCPNHYSLQPSSSSTRTLKILRGLLVDSIYGGVRSCPILGWDNAMTLVVIFD